MKNTVILWSLALGILVSCKSAVTTGSVLKQEEKAQKELKDAHEALVKLAQMKEKYSVDHKNARISELKKQVKKNSSDIDKLSGVASETAQGSTPAIIANLRSENKQLEEQIAALQNIPQENWSTAIEGINERVKELEQQIQQITANIDHSKE